jgi:hypothetical protein
MKELNTNFFKLILENGSVRHIKSGNQEIVRMIYSAVRDENWGTIEPKIIQESIANNESGFLVKTEVIYQKSEIHFEAVYSIVGKGNYLEFSMEGEAKSSFLTNRIGFCVLHPIKECTGKTCTVIHPDNSLVNFEFPRYISPEQPMINISRLEWNPCENIKARLTFSGDIFEMEDQRNWTDASYKTYCRPLSLPFPYEIKKGEKVSQKIVLEIYGESKTEDLHRFVSFEIDNNRRFNLPDIGVCSTSRKEPVEYPEAEILKHVPFQHLRAELKLYEKNFNRILRRAIDESDILELPLFLVLYFSVSFESELETFKNAIKKRNPIVKYILIVGENHLPNDLVFDRISCDLRELFPKVKIGTGVNAYFAELNRNRPKTKNADFVSFAICPQVHAFDNISLIENLAAQYYAVESAKKLFGQKPVFVSPVTLKQRFNVVATTTGPKTKPGELPPQVDTRQNSVFAAQWLTGSLKFLAQSGAGLVTFFETTGWRGIIQGNYDPPVQHKFNAKKGDVFPVYHLLREFEGFDEVIFSESNTPLELEGVVLSNKNDRLKGKILLTNFSKEEKRIQLEGIAEILGINSVFSSESIKTENDEILIPGQAVVKIGIKL